MTSMPAQVLGLKDRGLLREGYWGDVVVFDPDTVADTATYENPKQYPKGIRLCAGQRRGRDRQWTSYRRAAGQSGLWAGQCGKLRK